LERATGIEPVLPAWEAWLVEKPAASKSLQILNDVTTHTADFSEDSKSALSPSSQLCDRRYSYYNCGPSDAPFGSATDNHLGHPGAEGVGNHGKRRPESVAGS